MTRIKTTRTSEASRANPSTTARVPAKPETRSCKGRRKEATPTPINRTPARAVQATSRRAFPSRLERAIATCGGTEAASQAGGAAVRIVARTPTRPPFTRLGMGSPTWLTVVVKYRSLIVCRIMRTVTWPISTPRPIPHTDPTTPTMKASPITRPKTSWRVMPRLRRVPNKGRRCTTEKVMVL